MSHHTESAYAEELQIEDWAPTSCGPTGGQVTRIAFRRSEESLTARIADYLASTMPNYDRDGAEVPDYDDIAASLVDDLGLDHDGRSGTYVTVRLDDPNAAVCGGHMTLVGGRPVAQAQPLAGLGAGKHAQQPKLEISRPDRDVTVVIHDAHPGLLDDDGPQAVVVQIDSGETTGRIRINLNDAPVWDGDPETDEVPGAWFTAE